MTKILRGPFITDNFFKPNSGRPYRFSSVRWFVVAYTINFRPVSDYRPSANSGPVLFFSRVSVLLMKKNSTIPTYQLPPWSIPRSWNRIKMSGEYRGTDDVGGTRNIAAVKSRRFETTGCTFSRTRRLYCSCTIMFDYRIVKFGYLGGRFANRMEFRPGNKRTGRLLFSSEEIADVLQLNERIRIDTMLVSCGTCRTN